MRDFGGEVLWWVFAGSQSLVSQVADGAPADVIITADRISFDAALAAGFDGVDGDSGLPIATNHLCLLYTSPSPRDAHESRMPSSA